MSNSLKIKRGTKVTIPTLAAGEPGFCTDTYEFFVGTAAAGNKQIGGMANPMTTLGDVIVGGASGAPGRLGIGTAYQVPGVNAGATALAYMPSPNSVLTAAGDTLYASAANTLARLAKGTAYQSYNMNSGATAPAWMASLQSLMTEQGDVIYASAANTPAVTHHGNIGDVWTCGGHGANPSWATPAGAPNSTAGDYCEESTIDIAGAQFPYSYTLTNARIRIARAGTIRTRVSAQCDPGNSDGYGKIKIYKNGSPVGTERLVNWNLASTAEDLSVSAGDVLQVYAGATQNYSTISSITLSVNTGNPAVSAKYNVS